MKQFVGLYAIGEVADQTLPVYLSSLAGYDTAGEHRYRPLSVMPGLKRGLYVGIVTVSESMKVDVIPLKLANQKLFESNLTDEARKECLVSLDQLFGAAGDEGEATPAYVNQEQS